jgi:hypothetical protein
MRQGRRIAAVLAIAATATIAGVASARALSVGPTGTPAIPTPSTSVPPVTTTTPTVTVPEAPSVTLPPVPAPEVDVPEATVPKAPPAPALPKSGGGGSGGGGTAGGVVNGVKQVLRPASDATGGVTGNSSAGTSPKSGTAGGGGSSTSGSGNSGTTAGPGGTFGGPDGGGSAGGGFVGPGGFGAPGIFGGGAGTPAVFALGLLGGIRGNVIGAGSGGVSALAAAVASVAGCFYALTPFEQQVLTVRSGIDGRRALSRSALATLLGTTPKAIAATERGALGTLRSAARTNGCMPVGTPTPGSAPTAFIGGPFGPLGRVIPGMPSNPRVEPAGASPQTRLASTSLADQFATLNDADQRSLSILVVIVVMLSAALAVLVAEARRSIL